MGVCVSFILVTVPCTIVINLSCTMCLTIGIAGNSLKHQGDVDRINGSASFLEGSKTLWIVRPIGVHVQPMEIPEPIFHRHQRTAAQYRCFCTMWEKPRSRQRRHSEINRGTSISRNKTELSQGHRGVSRRWVGLWRGTRKWACTPLLSVFRREFNFFSSE
jgi:hypothetical protein